MIELEIADYERTVRTLHDTVDQRDSVIRELQAEVSRHQDSVTSLQQQLGVSLSHESLKHIRHYTYSTRAHTSHKSLTITSHKLVRLIYVGVIHI